MRQHLPEELGSLSSAAAAAWAIVVVPPVPPQGLSTRAPGPVIACNAQWSQGGADKSNSQNTETLLWAQGEAAVGTPRRCRCDSERMCRQGMLIERAQEAEGRGQQCREGDNQPKCFTRFRLAATMRAPNIQPLSSVSEPNFWAQPPMSEKDAEQSNNGLTRPPSSSAIPIPVLSRWPPPVPATWRLPICRPASVKAPIPLAPVPVPSPSPVPSRAPQPTPLVPPVSPVPVF